MLYNMDVLKFHEGDWIVSPNGVYYQIYYIHDERYYMIANTGEVADIPFSSSKLYHNFSIQDVKDGDIVSWYTNYRGKSLVQTGIVKEYVGKHSGCSSTFKIYAGINWDDKFVNSGIGKDVYMGASIIEPATEEQRKSLFYRIDKEGYSWNIKTKKLQKLNNFGCGDWIVSKMSGSVFQIEACIENKLDHTYSYVLTNGASISNNDIDYYYRQWTIQDTKEGDVLSIKWGEDGDVWEKIVLFKSLNEYGVEGYGCTFRNHEPVCKDGTLYSKIWDKILMPATQEQHNLLFKTIKERGYEWDEDKKELNKINTNVNIDNDRIDRICDFIWKNRKGDTDEIYQQEQDVKWLKSLKNISLSHSEPNNNVSKKNEIIGLIKEIKNQTLKRLEDYDGYIKWLESIDC